MEIRFLLVFTKAYLDPSFAWTLLI